MMKDWLVNSRLIGAIVVLSLCNAGALQADGAAAALVNGRTITTDEIEFAMSRLGEWPPHRRDEARRQVLDALIDQHLLMQHALDEGLDKEPKVIHALETARRQVLAQAYLERRLEGLAKPGDEEIAAYFDAHPELFSERKVYRLEEVDIQGATERAEAIRRQLDATKNLGDFIRWLDAEGISFRTGRSLKAAEQLPLKLAAELHRLDDGQAIAVTMTDRLSVIHVAESYRQPLSAELARPYIEQVLLRQKEREAREAEVRKARASARVEFVGDFAEGASRHR